MECSDFLSVHTQKHIWVYNTISFYKGKNKQVKGKQQNDAEMAHGGSKVTIEMFLILLFILCHRQTA